MSFLTNGLDTTTRGLDAVISETEKYAGGDLKFSAAFNRNYLHQDALHGVLANANYVNEAVLIPLEYGSPSTKIIISTEWSNDQWGGYIKPIRYGSMYAFSYDTTLPTIDGANVQKYGSAWTFDAELHLNVDKKTVIAIGGTDIFNRYPTQTTPGGSYYGSFPYNYANPLGINGAYYYARVAIKLGR